MIEWSSDALQDVARLYDFLASVNPSAAAKVVQQLVSSPDMLLDNPRIGEQLSDYEPREVRRLLIGHYEMRYELRQNAISILRIWHSREDRI